MTSYTCPWCGWTVVADGRNAEEATKFRHHVINEVLNYLQSWERNQTLRRYRSWRAAGLGKGGASP